MSRPPFLVVHRPIRSPFREKSPLESPRYTPPPKLSPLVVAKTTLGDRLDERDSGFWLDGSPAKLKDVMRETNRILKASDQPQVTVNPAWVVND